MKPSKKSKARKKAQLEDNAAAAMAGGVDFHGFVDGLGWIFCGWLDRAEPGSEDVLLEINSDHGHLSCAGRAVWYQSTDIVNRGIGFVVVADLESTAFQHLDQLLLEDSGNRYAIPVQAPAPPLDQGAISDKLRPILAEATSGPVRDRLNDAISRDAQPPAPVVHSSDAIHFAIEEAIWCPPDGVVLMGWQLPSQEAALTFRLCCGGVVTEFVPAQGIRVPRKDVLDALGGRTEPSDLLCGFILYLPSAMAPGYELEIEIASSDGRVGKMGLRLSTRSGLNAMRKILEGVNERYQSLQNAYDHVLGPAISALNDQRLALGAGYDEIIFGDQPVAPKISLLIPLHGRIDYVEYQMALFSAGNFDDIEVIYILDDPPLRRNTEDLCQSVHARFGIPFRLIANARNLGYAVANNVGLRCATGEYVCFLNSDIFPDSRDWLQRLTQLLESDSTVGAVGARLLFEDGSLQHDGCVNRPIAELAGWTFLDHPGKGRRPRPRTGLLECEAITGACMVMSRALALDLGGFDEAYIVGDFEDADLCQKIRERGLRVVVDPRVTLFHLERKSQAAPNLRWRMNLTLFNAWVYQRRWFASNTFGT